MYWTFGSHRLFLIVIGFDLDGVFCLVAAKGTMESQRIFDQKFVEPLQNDAKRQKVESELSEFKAAMLEIMSQQQQNFNAALQIQQKMMFEFLAKKQDVGAVPDTVAANGAGSSNAKIDEAHLKQMQHVDGLLKKEKLKF